MNLQENIQSQYDSALDMLHQAILKCPDELWNDTSYSNPFWRVTYHVLFFTHLYVHPGLQQYVPWARHRKEAGDLRLKLDGDSYTRAEMLEYFDLVCVQIQKYVRELELDAPSGFHWLPFNRLEVQIYNLRHLQHHTGELCERLGVSSLVEIDWVIKKKE